jgi:succinate dehydrogenase/fumarate reductase flavoprotein subunit
MVFVPHRLGADSQATGEEIMTSAELYEALDRAGVDYEIVEMFEGVRIISVVVDDEQTNTVLECSPTTGEKS